MDRFASSSAPRRFRLIALAAACALWSASASAADSERVSFQHHDWEVVCDNTRTCRAAGYHNDEDAQPVSVLLTRKAGPGAAVAGRVALGEDWDAPAPEMPARFWLALWIDGRAHGEIAMSGNTQAGDLSAVQVAALLKALRRDSRIEFLAQRRVWNLSDRGAAAVLLKMDEAQGRVGTVGALHRKGKQSEARVLPALPAPVVRAVAPHPPLPGDARLYERLIERHGDALRAALRARAGEDGCDALDDPGEEGLPTFEFSRLTKTRLLVSTRCWLAAYNAGSGYWVIDAAPPFDPQWVTMSGTHDDAGSIGAEHKARGLGDCWSGDRWTWDGVRFVHTESVTTGQCKGFPGGAWRLPMLVTDVKASN